MGIMINRRRVCGGKSLPYDAEIEYLESTGTQCIDTGIGLNTAYKYRLVVASVNGNNASNIWGYKSNASYTGGKCCIIGWTSANPSYIAAYNKNGNIIGFVRENITPKWQKGVYFDIILDVTKRNFSINNVNYFEVINSYNTKCLTTDSWSSSLHPRLFGTLTVNNIVPSQALSCKQYQVYDVSGNLIQDFIPVRIGNVGYMYDKVSKQLFGNSGTGAFILGSDK